MLKYLTLTNEMGIIISLEVFVLKHPLQKNKERALVLTSRISGELNLVQGKLNQIGNEYHRVAEISHHAVEIIDDIDRQFEKTVRLNSTDVAFLFFATALQCLRQYLLTPMTERKSHDEAAKKVKGDKKEHSDRSHRYYNPSLDEIITNPVPFDLVKGNRGVMKGYGLLGHRGATVGHDPFFGLFLGTANIATSTVTLWGEANPLKMISYHVTTGLLPAKGGKFSLEDVIPLSPNGIPIHADTKRILSETFINKLLHQGMDGKVIVGTSIAKEIIHLKSDLYSPDSLPLPAISAIDPKIAGYLAKRGLDMAMAFDVGRQFAYALAIDTVISVIHGFFYDPAVDYSRSAYEVRTRRILTLSNVLASTSNVIVAYFAQNPDLLDFGGFLNTIRHIAFDMKFIKEVKKDFLKNQLYDTIVGESYDFMEKEM